MKAVKLDDTGADDGESVVIHGNVIERDDIEDDVIRADGLSAQSARVVRRLCSRLARRHENAHDQFQTVLHAGLLEDSREVRPHGGDAQAQFARDLLVAPALDEQLDDAGLLGREGERLDDARPGLRLDGEWVG